MSTAFDADNYIDLREVIDRVEELREQRDNFDETKPVGPESNLSDEEAEELDELEALLEELRGYGGDHKWEGHWYPLGLIRDSYFTEAMKELVEDIGDLPHGLPNYLVIDWEATAEHLRMDYSSVDFAGDTFGIDKLRP